MGVGLRGRAGHVLEFIAASLKSGPWLTEWLHVSEIIWVLASRPRVVLASPVDYCDECIQWTLANDTMHAGWKEWF
jgi:hypothetical protein